MSRMNLTSSIIDAITYLGKDAQIETITNKVQETINIRSCKISAEIASLEREGIIEEDGIRSIEKPQGTPAVFRW